MTYPETAIPRFEYPADSLDPVPEYCVVCSEPHNADEGVFCNCHCSECGDELPETDDSHCQNCCECDACYEEHNN